MDERSEPHVSSLELEYGERVLAMADGRSLSPLESIEYGYDGQ
jgi:hypothetical protein